MENSNVRKGYKGFDKDLKCRGYQYEIGKTHTMEGNIEVCESGFHAIPEEESPMNVFEYYAPCEDGNPSRYCEVEASGKIEKEDGKIAASKLKVVAEIGIVGIVKAHIEWVLSRIKRDNKEDAHGDSYCSAATNTGDCSAATNTGNCSAAEVSGKESIAIVTGKDSKARGALGCWLVLTERGEWDGKTYPIIDVRAIKVDGEEIKPNTWYGLKDGNVVEM